MANIEDFEQLPADEWDDSQSGGSGESDADTASGNNSDQDLVADEEEDGDADDVGFVPDPEDNDPDAIWEHDRNPFEESRSRDGWGTPSRVSSTGIARTPYNDDRFDIARTRHGGWGSPYHGLTGWEYLTYEKGANTYTTLEEKQAIPEVTIGPSSDPATWDPPRPPITRLSNDLLRLIFELFVPPQDSVPVSGFYNTGGLGRICLNAVISCMRVGRWWYHEIMDFRGLWAAFVPAAKHPEIWRILVDRAGSANLRLLFHPGLPEVEMKELLPRAASIYATDSMAWSTFSQTFAGKILPHLELLYLRPLETYMTKKPLESHVGEPLVAPLLRVLETSTPLRIETAATEELGLSYHTGEQLAAVLTPDLRLTRLAINRPREINPIDWTALVGRVDYSKMTMLKIRALDWQGTRLNLSEHARLEMLDLRCLDSTAPISVAAPEVHLVKMFNVLVHEMMFLLEGMRGVRQLFLRWSSSDGDFAGYPEPLTLPALQLLEISGQMSPATLSFLENVRAPGLRHIQLFVCMDSPPDHTVLQPLRANVQSAVASQAADAGALLATLQHAHRTLRRGNHDVLADSLRPVIFPLFVVEMPTLESLLLAAQNLVGRLSEAENVGPTPHHGVLLREVLGAIITMVGANEGEGEAENDGESDGASENKSEGESEGESIGEGDNESEGQVNVNVMDHNELEFGDTFAGNVTFTARLRGGNCMVVFTLLRGWAEDWMNSGGNDSLTYRVARMLYGLEPLHPRTLGLIGEPLKNMEAIHGRADMNMLLDVLARYHSVRELHVDFTVFWHLPRTLCVVLEHEDTLPGLKAVSVRCRSANESGFHEGSKDEISLDIWLLIVEFTRARFESGRPLDTLSLVGKFCLSFVQAGAVEDWVPELDLAEAHCNNPRGMSECPLCHWR